MTHYSISQTVFDFGHSATKTTVATLVTIWRKRARSRRDLAHLDPHLLRDIGIDACDARYEARRSFWQ